MNHATLLNIYQQVMDAFNLSTVCFTMLRRLKTHFVALGDF